MVKESTKSSSDLIETMRNEEPEEDNIVIKSKFIKGIISKLISITIKKKLKCAMNLELNEIGIVTAETNVNVHLVADATIEKKDLIKIFGI